jgi:group I intron endonuclease
MAYKKDKVICGVYTITHVTSGRIYVGSSVHILSRWADHLTKLRHGTHEDSYLQATWTKYGESEFEFKIVVVSTREEVHNDERLWMEQTNCLNRSIGFNIHPDPMGRTGLPLSEEHKQKVSNSLKGRIFSDEHRKKLSDAGKGVAKPPRVIEAVRAANTGKPLSIAHRAKISKQSLGSGNGNSKVDESIIRAIKDDLVYGYYKTTIAVKYGLGNTTIGRILNGLSWKHVYPDRDILAERNHRLSIGKICLCCSLWKPFCDYREYGHKTYCSLCWNNYGDLIHKSLKLARQAHADSLSEY